jgi:hypothetical protein
MIDMATLLREMAEIIATGPALGAVTERSLQLAHEALSSDILGAQLIVTVPTDARRPIDVAYVAPTVNVRALPKGWRVEAPDWGSRPA